MPNTGTNLYAGAFATGQTRGCPSSLDEKPAGNSFTSARFVQKASFSSAAPNVQAPIMPIVNPEASFRTVRSAFCTSARPSFGKGLNKPFRVPSMAKPSSLVHPHVHTVETRLTQQSQAVILNPVAPTMPTNGYSADQNKDDPFSFLKDLAKTEMGDVAPPAPRFPSSNRLRASPGGLLPPLKRSKS